MIAARRSLAVAALGAALAAALALAPAAPAAPAAPPPGVEALWQQYPLDVGAPPAQALPAAPLRPPSAPAEPPSRPVPPPSADEEAWAAPPSSVPAPSADGIPLMLLAALVGGVLLCLVTVGVPIARSRGGTSRTGAPPPARRIRRLDGLRRGSRPVPRVRRRPASGARRARRSSPPAFLVPRDPRQVEPDAAGHAYCELRVERGRVRSRFVAATVEPGANDVLARSRLFWHAPGAGNRRSRRAALLHRAVVDELCLYGWQLLGAGVLLHHASELGLGRDRPWHAQRLVRSPDLERRADRQKPCEAQDVGVPQSHASV